SRRLFLEPLEERALLSGGLSGGGPGPSLTTGSNSGSQPAVVLTQSGGPGPSSGTSSGGVGISGPGYPLAPTSGPTRLDPATLNQPLPTMILVPLTGTPGGPSVAVVAVCTGGGSGPSGSPSSGTGL